MQLREITFEELEEKAARAGIDLPIEQTRAWVNFEMTQEGREFWGCAEIVDDAGATRALLAFMDYATHGYHYLRAHHAPIWLAGRTEAERDEALAAIARYVRSRDKRQAFVRLCEEESPLLCPVLSTLPYDQTVIVDVTGTHEERLARMKPRGRQDISKGVRKSGATFADETDLATASFDEYFAIMEETSSRDGFIPYPAAYYQTMVSTLGPDRCRVYAARIEGTLVAWTIITFSGSLATYYYGATSAAVRKNHANDALFSFIFDQVAERGCTGLDMMGIGSDFQPTLLGLNQFKTKFAKEVTHVAPDRDLPVRKTLYRALAAVRDLRDARRERAEKRAEAASRTRDDLLPVILGGDISVYAYGREFHEAFGVTSVAMNPSYIAAVEHSSIFTLVPVPTTQAEDLSVAITKLAGENPKKTLVVIPSTDALVVTLSEIAPSLPSNVRCPIPSPEALRRAIDKEEFAAACERCGLPTPATQVVSLAGTDPIAPVTTPFPVIAKPARTAEYAAYYNRGFQKVYAVSSQEELDELWGSLRAAGFGGDFLVQELIGGDDTHMGAFTFYVDAKGEMRLFGAAQTLLEDHAPTMRGNSVAMLVRDDSDAREKCARLIAELGYTGLGEIDAKRDPRTGEWVFFELNARAGRNSYYLVAGGVNPMQVVVEDVVDRRPARLSVATEPALYTLVPHSLLYRYLDDKDLLAEVRELVSKRRSFDPQRYAADRAPRHLLAVSLTEKNQVRKFARYYPRRTENSF